MGVFALNYHRMILREPGPGGAVRFARKVFGEDHGFLVGWFLIACGWLCMSDKRLVAKLQIGLILVAAVVISAAVYAALALLPVIAVPEGYASWADYVRAKPGLSGADAVCVFAAAKRLFGPSGIAFVGAAMLAGQLTGIFGAYVATSRLMYCLARNDAMPT